MKLYSTNTNATLHRPHYCDLAFAYSTIQNLKSTIVCIVKHNSIPSKL